MSASAKYQDINHMGELFRDGMFDLTGFQRDLLFTIAGLDQPHGLAIKEELQNHYEESINHGRLYPNIDTLVEKGLVKKGEKDARTNLYTITQRGKREIEARHEWESQYVNIDVPTA